MTTNPMEVLCVAGGEMHCSHYSHGEMCDWCGKMKVEEDAVKRAAVNPFSKAAGAHATQEEYASYEDTAYLLKIVMNGMSGVGPLQSEDGMNNPDQWERVEVELSITVTQMNDDGKWIENQAARTLGWLVEKHIDKSVHDVVESLSEGAETLRRNTGCEYQ